jgi:hypothetical protein
VTAGTAVGRGGTMGSMSGNVTGLRVEFLYDDEALN